MRRLRHGSPRDHVRPLRRLGWRGAGFLVLILLAAATVCVSCSRGGDQERSSVRGTIYYCPMHPAQTSDKPGDCPICQMRLVPIERPAGIRQSGAASRQTGQGVPPQSPGATGGTEVATPMVPPDSVEPMQPRKIMYRSTMNPSETSDRPGKDSMGMEMVPVESPVADDGHEAPPGRSEIQIPMERLQQIGVTFGTVATKRAAGILHTTGRVALDETRVHHVHTKFSGWIERLHVDYEGKRVARGDPLFTIFSPDLVATQEELLRALEARRSLGPSPDPDLGKGVDTMIEAARRRLALWDVSPDEIARLETSKEIQRAITIHSETEGIVVQKNVNHGMYVDPSSEEFAIADLSHVWILADLYENEVAGVREGQIVDIRFPMLAGAARRGRIAYVQPAVDPATRTIKARIDVANPHLELKLGMLADVGVRVDAGVRTVVPKTAVIQTGRRAVVFLDLGGGRLLPREIETGVALVDEIEVLSGLSPGDRVVTSASFLIDSESRLRAAVAAALPSSSIESSVPDAGPASSESPARGAPLGPNESRPGKPDQRPSVRGRP